MCDQLPAGRFLLPCVFFLSLHTISCLTASHCQAEAKVLRVESRPLQDFRGGTPSDRKKSGSTMVHYLCKELPFLQPANYSITGQYTFSSKLQLLNSSEGQYLASVGYMEEQSRVNVSGDRGVAIVNMLGSDSGNYQCEQAPDCTEERLSKLSSTANVACLDVITGDGEDNLQWRKPYAVRLLPPGPDKGTGGSPVLVSSGGAFGGAPPDGPGGGSPGGLEFFSFTSTNDWFSDLLANFDWQSSVNSLTVPPGVGWQLTPAGHWFRASVDLDSNCYVNDLSPVTMSQMLSCITYAQIALSFTLLAQSSPELLVYMDKPKGSGVQPSGGGHGEPASGGGREQQGGGTREQQNQQQPGNEERQNPQPPQPPSGGAGEAQQVRVTVEQLQQAALSYVIRVLQQNSELGLGGNLVTLVNQTPAISLVLSYRSAQSGQFIRRELSQADVLGLFQAEEVAAARGMMALWLLHQHALTISQPDPWVWVTAEIGHRGSENMAGSLESGFVNVLQQWIAAHLPSQVQGGGARGGEAIEETDEVMMPEGAAANVQGIHFVGGLAHVYSLAVQDGIVEEAGVPPAAAPLELAEDYGQVHLIVGEPGELVERHSEALRTLLLGLMSSQDRRRILSRLFTQQTGQQVPVGAQGAALVTQVMSFIQENPAQLIPFILRVFSETGLRERVLESCESEDCEELPLMVASQPLSDGLPALTGSDGSLHPELALAIERLIQTQVRINQALNSRQLFQWMRQFRLLSEEEVSELEQQGNVFNTLAALSNAGAEVLSQWFQLVARLGNLSGQEALNAFYERLLSSEELRSHMDLTRSLEVIRVAPGPLPEPTNMMEYCRRLEPAQTRYYGQLVIIRALFRAGLISYETFQACPQAGDCSAAVLVELQSQDAVQVWDTLRRLGVQSPSGSAEVVSELVNMVPPAQRRRLEGATGPLDSSEVAGAGADPERVIRQSYIQGAIGRYAHLNDIQENAVNKALRKIRLGQNRKILARVADKVISELTQLRVIGWSDAQRLQSEQNPTTKAMSMLDVVERGGAEAYQIFVGILLDLTRSRDLTQQEMNSLVPEPGGR